MENPSLVVNCGNPQITLNCQEENRNTITKCNEVIMWQRKPKLLWVLVARDML